VMTFMESLYGASELVDPLNEATRKAGIKHSPWSVEHKWAIDL
jgi:hypothetical protein